MSTISTYKPDPNLDLVLERTVDVPRELVWKAWTTPEHLKQWFAPKPWKTIEAVVELRPGGLFRTVMQSPEGQTFPGDGCVLEVVPNERLTWTGALLPHFRPAKIEPGVPVFSAIIALETVGKGTRYTATAIHRDEEGKKAHEAMGFHAGWGMCLEQLVALVKTW